MFRRRGAARSRAPVPGAANTQTPNPTSRSPDHELRQDDPLARRTSGAYMPIAASRDTFAPVIAKSGCQLG
jgi:hypothetical protein